MGTTGEKRYLLICTYMFISIAIITSSEPQNSSCPCHVNTRNQSMNCSGRNLTSLPSCVLLKVNMKYLDLSVNLISILPPKFFANLSDLQSLDLSHNLLTHIGNEAFEGLSKVSVLSLAFNYLDKSDSYGGGVFEPLSKLQTLHIQGNINIYVGANFSYPDTALSKGRTIHNLSIDGLPRTLFGPGFKEMDNLKVLTMNNDDGYCRLGTILPETFHNFQGTSLERIEILDCKINSLPRNTFEGLHNLMSITSTNARNLCDGSIDNITMGLNTTNVKRLELSSMCNGLTFRLNENTFKGITNSSLETLILEWDRIEYIDPKCIYNLPKSLKYLSLRGNFIDDVHFLENIVELTNLEVFDCSFQNNYREVPSQENNVTRLPEEIMLKAVASNDRKFLFKKHISQDLCPRTTNKTDDRIHLPPKLKYMYMNNLKLDSYAIIPLTFAKNELYHLDASSCLLNGFLGPWIGLHDLQFLNLSYNRFTFVHPKSFSDMLNLTTLLLQNNEIGKEIAVTDAKGDLFSSLLKLEILDLANNKIKSLPNLIFRNQRRLRYLSLASNAIANFTFTLETLIGLQFLNLSDNQIGSIPVTVLQAFDKIALITNLNVDLQANPLICDCEHLDFVNWLVKTKVTLVQGTNLTCRYTNGSLVSLRDKDTIRAQLEIECITWIVLIACVVTFVGLLLIGSLIAVCYHKRWQLRYIYSKMRQNLNPYHPIVGEEIEITNDVYISFDPDYELTGEVSLDNFVKQRLYQYLKDHNLSVTLPDDLKAGIAMDVVVTETLRCTRKVIVLLSPTYCDSHNFWNVRLFNLAVYEGIYTARSIIVPVLIGEITPHDLRRHPEIMSCLKSMGHNVLRFSGREEDTDLFLDTLYKSLRD